MHRLSVFLCVGLAVGACSDDGDGKAPDGNAPVPITAAPLTWTYVPFDDTSCGNGEPLGLAVNLNPDEDRVMIFLEGGGWCWNAETCQAGNGDVTPFTFSGVNEDIVLDILETGKRGILDRTDPLNPFRDYNIVYVPYCTGDMHFGREANPGYPTAHVGALNMEAFLARIVPTFPNARQVVLSGVSAGAYGALWNYHGVQTAFGQVPVHLLSDSGPAFGAPAFPDALLSAFISGWGLEFPDICSTCTTLPELLVALTTEHADRRQAFVATQADLVLRQLFGRTADGGLGTRVPVVDYAAGVDNMVTILESAANAKPFSATTDQHVFVDKVLGTTVKETSVGQWLTAFEAGDPSWSAVVDDGDVFQFEPSSLGLSYGDPEGDVAYAYPTAPDYGTQQDLRRVIVSASGRNLEVEIRTAELSNESGAANGFDNLAVTIFIEQPGGAGLAELPLLNASAPADLRWTWMHRLSGNLNDLHTTEGASATMLGERSATSPAVNVALGLNQIKVTYEAPEGSDWAGARIFVTTWDVDPATGDYLEITPNAGQQSFGGAPGPKIMDDVPPILVPPTVVFTDPQNDERYQYPTDEGFEGAGDILGATVLTSGGATSLSLQMRELTTLWNPPNGFDHVTFTIFFHHPDRPGATVLPFLNAEMPDGLDWFAMARVHGFGNDVFGADGATADAFGPTIAPVPQVSGSVPARSVTLSFAQDFFGLPSFSGGKIYVTTWDFDGIRVVYRELGATPGQFEYGGGEATDPKLMDTLMIDVP